MRLNWYRARSSSRVFNGKFGASQTSFWRKTVVIFTHVSNIGFLVLFCFYFRKKNCPINDSLLNCNDCEMVSKCKNYLKVHIEMYTCEVANSSHCCSTVFPSALALKSHKRYKHLRKTCKISKKSFHSLSKLTSPKKAFHKDRTNL